MKRFQLISSCILLTVGILTGCSSFGESKKTYSNERVDTMYEELNMQLDRAKSFAQELCVIKDVSPRLEDGIQADAAGIFGIDDLEVSFEKQAMERLYPASITKVMTALVAIKYGNLQDNVTVGEETLITESGATMCNIKPGDTLTLEELLYGLMLPSGNDAGSAIAVHMAGSIQGFSDLMNQEALLIGATDSHFLNPHGLHDEQHYTTAYDLYLIFREALKYTDFRTLVEATSYTANYTDGDGVPKSQTWKNSNKYLTGEESAPAGITVLGGKTGTTKAAGYCLIIASEDSAGKEYISVVLKSDSRPHLYESMTNIIRKIVN